MTVLEKLKLVLAALEENHQWHQDYDAYGGYLDSVLWQNNVEAINKCKLLIYHYELEDEPDSLTVAYMSGYHDGKKSKEND